MLTALQISNIALIDSQELVFGPGFTVLTGETGAGKSILLDALDAVTGGGQPQRLLRDGCLRGSIEASFGWTKPLRQWCQAQELDLEEEEESSAEPGGARVRGSATDGTPATRPGVRHS